MMQRLLRLPSRVQVGAVVVASLGLFAVAGNASAQVTRIVTCSGVGNIKTACNFCDIFVVIHNIFNFLALTIAPLLVIILFIVGGLILMFGGGSSTLLERGKSIIKGTLIGLVIILISWVIINTTINLLTGTNATPEGFPWPWWAPECGTGGFSPGSPGGPPVCPPGEPCPT